MRVYDTTFCFVNSRKWYRFDPFCRQLRLYADIEDLAAFANALDRRRADYSTLLTGLSFPCSTGSEDVLALDEFGSEISGRSMGIEDCHTIVNPQFFKNFGTPAYTLSSGSVISTTGLTRMTRCSKPG